MDTHRKLHVLTHSFPTRRSSDLANIHNIAVKGVFDECQDIVKALAGGLQFKSKYHLGAVNSINWARIAAQVVYYFWGWLRSTSGLEQQVSLDRKSTRLNSSH